jgi:hypothetical protein
MNGQNLLTQLVFKAISLLQVACSHGSYANTFKNIVVSKNYCQVHAQFVCNFEVLNRHQVAGGSAVFK